MKTWVTATVLTVSFGACAGDLRFSSFSTEPDVQRLVILPDTQCYAHRFPEILEAQSQWIEEAQEAQSIVAVVHLGDIVETNTTEEWARAQAAYAPLITSLPTVLLPGNHDFGNGGSADERTSLMKDFFPASDRFVGREGDTYSEEGWNSWTSVTIGQSRWLLMGLEFAPRREVAEWARGVFAEQSFDHALIATHAYLGSDGFRYGEPGALNQPFHPSNYGLFDDQSLDGQGLWDDFIRNSQRTRFVVSGHVPRGFHHRRVLRADGEETIELLIDYQQGTICPETGGDGRGFLQVLELREDDNSLQVRMVAYSPWLDAFAEDYGSAWSLSL